MKRLLFYFLRGLLFVFPLAATAYLFIAAVKALDKFLGGMVNLVLGIDIPGLGIIITFVAIVIVGYLITSLFGRPFYNLIDKILRRMPLVKILYTALKDFSDALFGENRKFQNPVMVKMSSSGIMKFGFITQKDLSHFNIKDMVAVYMPYSYGVIGDFVVVPKENIKLIDVNSTDLMKFILSAGVTNIGDVRVKKNVYISNDI